MMKWYDQMRGEMDFPNPSDTKSFAYRCVKELHA